ncbi:CsbD family protein [Methylicorpusculum oleiharenae]|uniref:CsbD family protein n=1 Tax=Methylicorpusculum oleiharenae TaxID=1338687 RepID=UPI0013582DB3|nr:CsbD family protein [Methylicorpusculum oleiharenae]MCD2450386.1 CsbD family protein [Methylicorpusculum oleiharenae]
MNKNQLKGNWMQLKGTVKEKWGDLTEDEVEQIAGNRDILLGKIQEKYGIAQEEAEKQIEEWENLLD